MILTFATSETDTALSGWAISGTTYLLCLMCRVPDSMTTEEAAMLEPLSVAVYACQRGGVGLGQSIVIFGAGPVGMLCGLVAKATGASQICIVGKVYFVAR